MSEVVEVIYMSISHWGLFPIDAVVRDPVDTPKWDGGYEYPWIGWEELDEWPSPDEGD